MLKGIEPLGDGLNDAEQFQDIADGRDDCVNDSEAANSVAIFDIGRSRSLIRRYNPSNPTKAAAQPAGPTESCTNSESIAVNANVPQNAAKMTNKPPEIRKADGLYRTRTPQYPHLFAAMR